MSVARKHRTGDHYACSTCQGKGRLQLSDRYQVVLDAVRTLSKQHGVCTLRMLVVEFPAITKSTLQGRLLFLRKKEFVQTDWDVLHGTFYLPGKNSR